MPQTSAPPVWEILVRHTSYVPFDLPSLALSAGVLLAVGPCPGGGQGGLATQDCRIAGLGEIEAGASFSGVIEGDGSQVLQADWVHLGPLGPEEVVSLMATKLYDPSRFFDAETGPSGPRRFELPDEVPVVVGNAGNHWLAFDLHGFAEDDDVRCCYRGGASQSHPAGESQIALGRRYVFDRCVAEAVLCEEPGTGTDVGLAPGDSVVADALSLSVRNGSNLFPTRANAETTVRLDLVTTPPRQEIRLIGIDLEGDDLLSCRPNGASLADFEGPATLDREPGFRLRVAIQDRGAPRNDPDLYQVFLLDVGGAIVFSTQGLVVSGDIEVDLPQP